MLHDIGYTEGNDKEHYEKGVEIAKRELPKFEFTEDEIEQISHCIKEHHGNPKTIEAKILFDADLLEKSDFVVSAYRVQHELGISSVSFYRGF